MKPSVNSPQTKAQHTVRGRSSHNGRHKPSRESDAYKTADTFNPKLIWFGNWENIE